jgi:hypothetical protein
MRLAIHRGVQHAGTLFVCVVMGSIAARIAKYFGAPIEVGLTVFVLTTAAALVIWYRYGGDE